MARARAMPAHRAPAPRHPRRVSGPVPAPARPTPVPGRPRPTTPITSSHSAVGASLRALPDHRLLDGLLRSRAWIWLLGIALGGIVFMQVSLLQMNNGIGNAVAASTELEHSNALLSEEVAELSSGELVRAQAAEAGLIIPDASALAFVTARGEVDASRAADAMTPPSDAAVATEQTAETLPVAEATPPPVATIVPEVTSAPTVDPAVAAVATVDPAVATDAAAVAPTDYATTP